MKIEVKILDPRVLEWGFPHYGSDMAAGLDLFACLDRPFCLEPQFEPLLVRTGIAIRIADPDWCGLVLPRSGRGHKEGLVCGNGTGVIDADYEGEIYVSAWNRNPWGDFGADDNSIALNPGDRIAQLVFTRIARPQFEIVTEFSGGSDRGDGGFGSTGR